jgi:hypothetical protein
LKQSLKYFFASFILLFFLNIACKKTSVLSLDDYLNITVNGVDYNRVTDSGYLFTNQNGCVSNKPYVLEKVGQVSTSTFFFHLYINYYQNNSDFMNAVPGDYSVTPAFIPNNAPCNLGIELSCDSVPHTTSSAWVLQNSGNNTYSVKSISAMGETSTSKMYQVIGEFSVNFKDSTNKLIPVSGKFQKTLSVLKQ